MINITQIIGISNSYPEEIEGTNEWYSSREESVEVCDLYEAQEIFNKNGFFKGINYHLIHYPDGKVHSPFQIQANIYVEKPIWNNGVLNFLVIDFVENLIRITEYMPAEEKLEVITELHLSEVEDCYNLMLETTPLTLGRSGHDGFYEIVWPEKKKIAIGETETVLFRDEDKLYLSEWYEDPDYHENVIVRDIQTGNIIEKSEGYLRRLPNNVYWKI
ncbi:hypothetical protein SAMN02745248_01249 [Hathewaya proteolytica DSM 3090]|uniref:Uncharacterized protein n=1 Tax=Hathewaya proteolytica DSM 3090 TaxID=1121331 RepID=A0A1M6N3C3_9CLOT|nr:hypothetical protein [Hathewaya proteolytica]SHJ90176.1 hypothetical protein SAMN02745248_01249 [Hathewaya proteolytica DSM 3090]